MNAYLRFAIAILLVRLVSLLRPITICNYTDQLREENKTIWKTANVVWITKL